MAKNNKLIILANGGDRKLYCSDNLLIKAVTTCIAFNKQAIHLAKKEDMKLTKKLTS